MWAQTLAGEVRTHRRVPRAAELNGRSVRGTQEDHWVGGNRDMAMLLCPPRTIQAAAPVPGMPAHPRGQHGKGRSSCSDACCFHGDTEQRMP